MARDALSNPIVGDSAEQLVNRIGHLARQMREDMRELGLDKGIARVTEAIPDARERLNYVARMTERAAERALNAVDTAQPIQESLSRQASGLTERWDFWFSSALELDDARDLVIDTRSYLSGVPQQVNATHAQLMEIMMAQDFQDLTGQVVKKMMDMIQDIETQLMRLLIDNTPMEKRLDSSNALLNGPQIRPGNPDAVENQNQVDDLLANLGF
ncbi:MAG: protein phosphatase CheZ [Polaromonas sp. 39-63-203]|jgi:chemotaxis protein CheZ|uniref:protein phosphatase CheZ n=1 Tax=Polaromonas sp. TaxID=1869339 RepID=UPI000BC4BFC1|nr:protein phosphatase CheZ [Polaromonas sp.]OYY53585.1 MAG: protein phosphatase CheZ [Polaromonas sp. 35-63-240]OYZ03248.1 MAG: protein phosphatase CheZ [Polaromonas sp. 28-63-22]OYZ85017.1 MAG: protein phosphatase CheZ [Polaromonas sp. 24-62-144]OZB02365.1 MAG: protein phosphatase CheZ [Polaromonas sp. 39-63-203]HQS32644.1 protein phosphatase CheZ [Polaromonas sp.]